MNNIINVVGKSRIMKDLIFSEIIKRHVEQYDPECISLLTDIKNKFTDIIPDISTNDSIFFVGISLGMDLYNRYINNYKLTWGETELQIKHDYPIIFDFDKHEIKHLYEQLIKISYKYNIVAPEILYPLKMDCLIDYYPDNLPLTTRFIVDDNKKFKLYPSSRGVLVEVIYNEITEDDVDFLKNEFLLQRLVNNYNVTPFDKELYSRYSSKNEKDSFREDSFIRNLIGLYSWDIEKRYKGKYPTALELQKQLIRKCSIECSVCDKLESCQKYIRDSYRIVRMSIYDKEIKHSKTTSKSSNSDVKPTGIYILKRCSPRIFFGEPDDTVDISAYFALKK